VWCCFLLYTLRTFHREHCIVLQGLQFTEDYICSSTAEQCCRVWGSPCHSPVRLLPTHSDQSLWRAISPIKLIHKKNSMLNRMTVCPLQSNMCMVLSLKVPVTVVGSRRRSDSMDIFLPSSIPYLYVYNLFIRPQRKPLYHPSLISYHTIMLLTVLFYKLSFWVSREKGSLAALQQAFPRRQIIWSVNGLSAN